jgi:hypothetical protein
MYAFQMPRNYKSRGIRGTWQLEDLQKAVNYITAYQKSEKSAAKIFGIPRQTLRRHLQKAKDGLGVEKVLGRPRILTVEQEAELTEVILDMERRLFGLTKIDIRRLVYRFCKVNDIRNNFNHENQCAGEDWMVTFMINHPELSLRKPEPTSLARASGFNKEKVGRFFDCYESLLFSNTGGTIIPPCRIFNADESGFTVCHTPGKIVAEKGKRSVGAVTSLEKGKTITVLCCVSASGTYVPPMIIFPRVRMKPAFMDKAPAGSIGVSTKTGWINEELFTRWFDHFLEITQPAACQSKTLLIVDGHSSHVKNFDVIMKARANNVIILSLPSHCTHRLQPLDVSFFKPLNARYNSAVQTWHRQHPGRPVTEAEFGELFNIAYASVASLEKAQSGFQKTGLHPFDHNIFTSDDFIAAEATNRPIDIQDDSGRQDQQSPSDHIQASSEEHEPASQIDKNPMTAGPEENIAGEPSCTSLPANSSQENVDEMQPSLEPFQAVDTAIDFTSLVQDHGSTSADAECNDSDTLTFAKLVRESISSSHKKLKRSKTVQHAAVVTSSPYKRTMEIMKAQNKTDTQKGKKTTKPQTLNVKERNEKQSKMAKSTGKDKLKRTSLKRKVAPNVDEAKKVKKPKKVDDAECLYCCELFSASGGRWIECTACCRWAHVECAGVSYKTETFICDICKA